MSVSSQAWMLDSGGGTVVAVAASSVLHVVEDTSLIFRVPLGAAHCNQVLVWQRRVLPVVDLAVLMTGLAPISTQSYACVLGWRALTNETEYGVLLLRGLPRRISVDDAQSTAPSDAQADSWEKFALSFFSYHGRAVPIIDPAILFDSKQLRLADQTSKRLTNRSA
jgi:chemotaxis signal transduction protein